MGAGAVRDLARAFAAADAAVAYGRIGTSTQAFGAVSTWLLVVLNVLTGNLDRPGGAMFTTPAIDGVLPRRSGGPARWHSRVVRGLPEFGGELPVAVLGEEMLTPGEGQVRGMVTMAGNPVLSTPNGGQLDDGFANLDAYVAIDIHVNETTRHADVILPPTTGLEAEHYDLTFNLLAVRNVATWSDPCFAVGDDRRTEADIIRGLVRRLATDERPWDESNPLHGAPPSALVAAGLRDGPYDLTLDDLRAAPAGVDLGPLEPRLPERLFTDDHRIHLAPDVLVDDLVRVTAWLADDEPDDDVAATGSGPGALALIGRRHLRDNNSWMHNAERLVRGRPRCTVLVHPDDAARRGLVDGKLPTELVVRDSSQESAGRGVGWATPAGGCGHVAVGSGGEDLLGGASARHQCALQGRRVAVVATDPGAVVHPDRSSQARQVAWVHAGLGMGDAVDAKAVPVANGRPPPATQLGADQPVDPVVVAGRDAGDRHRHQVASVRGVAGGDVAHDGHGGDRPAVAVQDQVGPAHR